jgi:anti-sigma B factor antagonist
MCRRRAGRPGRRNPAAPAARSHRIGDVGRDRRLETSMQLETRVVSDVVIVRVIGDITLGKGGDIILKDKINSLLQDGQRKILIDLGQVSYVDSAGLGQLVAIHATTARAGALLKLLNVTKRLRDLLVVTKLLVVFDTFDSEAAALAEFAKTAGV